MTKGILNSMKTGGLALVKLLVASGLVLGATACTDEVKQQDKSNQSTCESMVGSTFGDGTVVEAKLYPAGTRIASMLPLALRVYTWIKRIHVGDLQLPTACRLRAKVKTAAEQYVTVDVWLPERWNGKLLGVGGGGLNGGLVTAPLVLRVPLMQGYAGVASDAGHDLTESGQFAQVHDKLIDYAYRANHVAVLFAKSLLPRYYSRPVKIAYFEGCSNGGRDALMEARRYPEDYQGIVAGAPAAPLTQLMSAFMWNWQAIHGAQGAHTLPKKLRLVQDAATKECDAIDGVKDGVIENPLACHFDPAELSCHGNQSSECLTDSEVTAFRKIYDGPHLSDGERVLRGQVAGGEALPDNWDPWITSKNKSGAALGTEFFRWFVYGNKDWQPSDFQIDRDYPVAEQRVGSILRSDDPDLSEFVGVGGKLILYHGWDDAAIPAESTLDYYEALRKRLGAAAQDHVRLFMIPGMMHCGMGPGATSFDMLPELDHWFETERAPETILATKYSDDVRAMLGGTSAVVRTRPLCAWPKTAHYSGSGSTDEAANFRCE